MKEINDNPETMTDEDWAEFDAFVARKEAMRDLMADLNLDVPPF